MGESKRLLLLILIMAAVALLVGATSIGILYRTAVEQQRLRLIETAQSQARLLESIARFNQLHSTFPGGPRAATLAQIKDAHEHFRRRGLGDTGEFTLARREGEDIVFILRHRHSKLEKPMSVPIASDVAEPMRRALSGLSGTVVGPDYRGETVLAAYEPVDILDLGIVAKIDLAEIREPFIKAGAIVLAIALAVIAVGTAMFFRISEPIVRRMRSSEERFGSITGSARDAIVAIDAAGSVVLWNKAAEGIFGFSEAEMVGKPLTAIIPERYRQAHSTGLERVGGGGPSRVMGETLELEALRKDGSEISVSLSVSTWTSEGKRYFTGILRDISKRKRAEQRLRESDARWHSLVETQTLAIVIVEQGNSICFANKAAEYLFGQPASKLLGTPFSHPLIEGELAEIDIHRSNGSVAHAEMQAFPTVWKGQQQHLVLINDVSARKLAERDVGKMFQAIEQSPTSVVITDVQGRIEYVNPKFREMTGYSMAEMIGQRPSILKSGGTPAEAYADLWRTIEAGHVWSGEFHNRRKNGELFWELASIAPVKNAKGDITSFVCVTEDITQRKAVEEQLRQSQKMEAVGQLTGGIAHDFNNLLAIIIGNLQLLQEMISADREAGELLSDALWSAQRGAELTHRLLAFGRRQPLRPEALDVNEVVLGMTDMLRRTLGSGVEIDERLGSGLSSAFADRGELERALVNLAVNARDAMEQGGTLAIETRNEIIHPELATDGGEIDAGDYVVLALTDTGIGMSREILGRVFEPFFTTKGVGKGSGLGLSMVYGFAKQSGGHITVHSEIGHGTTVKLYLPKADPSVLASPQIVAGELREVVAGKLVLIVEDETKLRKIAGKMLENIGLRVVEAKNAAEAVQCLEKLPGVDLLFIDLELPGEMRGGELAEEVRKSRPGIRVIYTTAFAENAVPGDRPTHAGEPLIFKPYSQEHLARQVHALFAASTGRDD